MHNVVVERERNWIYLFRYLKTFCINMRDLFLSNPRHCHFDFVAFIFRSFKNVNDAQVSTGISIGKGTKQSTRTIETDGTISLGVKVI